MKLRGLLPPWAHALFWLKSNRKKGKHAEEAINAEFSDNPAVFYAIDLADEVQIHAMADWVLQNYGVPDVIFNNATITKMGAVDQVEPLFGIKAMR